MIELDNYEALRKLKTDNETSFICRLILDLFSFLFKTEHFSSHASLFFISDERELDNYKDMRLSEKLSANSFEFVDVISVNGYDNKYYLCCVIPSDDFGVYILVNQNIIKRNKDIFTNNNSRAIVLDKNSTYNNFL